MAPRKKKTSSSKLAVSDVELVDINVLGFNIPYTDDKSHYSNEVKEMRFGVTMTFFSRKDYHIKIVIAIDCLLSLEEEGEEMEAGFTAEFIFKASPSNEGDEDFSLSLVPEPLKHVVASVAYSTMRGVMYARAAGTILEDAILPIVSSKDLLAATVEVN